MKYTHFITILFLIVFKGFSQDREELKKGRMYYSNQLEKAKKLIEISDSEKKISITQLKTINYQIDQTLKLEENLRLHNVILNTDIEKVKNIIQQLNDQTHILKKEYAHIIYTYVKTQNNYQTLSFIFSSKSIDQFISRINFLKQYQGIRKSKIEYINKKIVESKKYQRQLEKRFLEQKIILKEIHQISLSLRDLKLKKIALQKTLREKIKQPDIVTVQKLEKKTNKQILAVVDTKSKKSLSSSLSFDSAKKKLIWPVSNGIIISKFGKHPHPVIEGIEVDNLGVDIRTQKRDDVRAVFDGKVLIITKVPGLHYMVIIQHGLYFTAYARLSTVYVKTGQEVKLGTRLGEITLAEDGIPVLQFQIWKNKQRLNPESWLIASYNN